MFSPKQKAKISFSDWPVLDIDSPNAISATRGGRKQSRTASCFRHVLLTLAGFPRRRRELISARTQPQDWYYPHEAHKVPESVDTVKVLHQSLVRSVAD